MTEPLAESLQAFLRDHMTTFERLECLMYLRGRAAEEHTARSISDALRIPSELILDALIGLVASELIRRGAAEGKFQFGPATPALAGTVEALASAYGEHRAAVLSAMSMYAIERIRSGRVRAFADAFVLGKGKRDG